MYVNGTGSSAQVNGTAATNNSNGLGSDTTQTFLTLLMTQLKTQDPLSPMDPTQMVSQLVQFNTLGQLMDIRALVQQQVDGTSATNESAVQTGAGGQ